MSAPIRVLELRSVRGTGGGPEKTILLGAARSDPRRVAVTVCYIRDARDEVFGVDALARELGLDYTEVRERHSFDPSIWPALRQLVRDRQIDIVHAHEYKTDLLAWLLARVEDVIPLATVHGWTGHTRREKFYYAADKRLLARFPRVIAVSSEIRATLERAGAKPDRITTVLNGIDHRIFCRDPRREIEARRALGLVPGLTAIGSVGRLEPQKHFDLLLEVFARLREGRPHIRLFIAGDGGSRPELESAAQRLGLASTCRFLGHCSDVAQFHHALDLFVQSSYYEGTPNAVLEAMALETPVIATRAGGTGELIDHEADGLLVPPRDAEALFRAIEYALSDPEGMRRRAAAARARIESRLSFAARMEAVEAVYEELVATHVPRGTRRRAVRWA